MVSATYYKEAAYRCRKLARSLEDEGDIARLNALAADADL